MHRSRCIWQLSFLVVVTVFLAVCSSIAYATTDATIWDLAVAKIDAEDLAAARDALTQLLQQYPASPRAPGAQLKLAYIGMKLNPGSDEEIVNAFSQVRAKYPSSPEAADALARIGYLHTKSSTRDAISDFTQFLDAHPNHRLAAGVQQSLGRLLLKTRELDKAEAAFDVVKTTPGASATMVDEAALQSGFVKIMRFYADKNKTHLSAAIATLGDLTDSGRVKTRARADLGIAEALLLLGRPSEARERYRLASTTYSDQPYFRGIALFGSACSSQRSGRLADAVTEYTTFIASQPGATLAERDAAWKMSALASTSANAAEMVLRTSAWRRLPGSELVFESAYNQARCLYLLRRYDEAGIVLQELVRYAAQGSDLHIRATQLLQRCQSAKGGMQK